MKKGSRDENPQASLIAGRVEHRRNGEADANAVGVERDAVRLALPERRLDDPGQVIGLPAKVGRTFTEAEDKIGGPLLVVISDRLWQRVFQGDPGIIGKAVTLQSQPATVIGVMPPEMTSPQDVDAWFPIMRRTNNDAS